ncbi:hypothetical protein SESBI_36015 [Sesbania bispinosa]|nr:hypothetical protein SESBI_36015 [Sesbania bispinosa]
MEINCNDDANVGLQGGNQGNLVQGTFDPSMCGYGAQLQDKVYGDMMGYPDHEMLEENLQNGPKVIESPIGNDCSSKDGLVRCAAVRIVDGIKTGPSLERVNPINSNMEINCAQRYIAETMDVVHAEVVIGPNFKVANESDYVGFLNGEIHVAQRKDARDTLPDSSSFDNSVDLQELPDSTEGGVGQTKESVSKNPK